MDDPRTPSDAALENRGFIAFHRMWNDYVVCGICGQEPRNYMSPWFWRHGVGYVCPRRECKEQVLVQVTYAP